MRVLAVLALVIAACGSSAAATRSTTPTPSVSPLATTPACPITTIRDAAGVVTADGKTGILGNAWNPGSTAMYDQLVLVRRDAHEGQQVTLRFR